MMTDQKQWQMPEWMREAFNLLDTKRIWHSPITLEKFEKYCSPGDRSFSVSKMLYETFSQLHSAGLLITPGERQERHEAAQSLADAVDAGIKEATRLRAENADLLENYKRADAGLRACCQSKERIRAENERLRGLLERAEEWNIMSDNLKPCREECARCGAHTGNAGIGEDSLFVNDTGPLCEFCFNYYALLSGVEKVRDQAEKMTKRLFLKYQQDPGGGKLYRAYDLVNEKLTALIDRCKGGGE